jgi:hypothetical protein
VSMYAVDFALIDERNVFIDTGVYTRNRLFRTAFSSKLKPERVTPVLQASEANKFVYDASDPLQLFLASMVQNVAYADGQRMIDLGVTSVGAGGSKRSSTSATTPHAAVAVVTSSSPYAKIDALYVVMQQTRVSNESCYLSSIARHDIIRRGGVVGFVRSTAYFASSKTTLYEIGG